MGAAEKLSLTTATQDESGTAREKVERTFSEELIIGICAPIGSNKKPFLEALKKRLADYNYDCEVIKLSDIIKANKSKVTFNMSTFDTNGKTNVFRDKIEPILIGNALRDEFHPSVLAEFAIVKIFLDRFPGEVTVADIDETLKDRLSDIYKTRRKCFIIDSIKNKEELLLFRTIYRELFYFFSLFTPLEERKETLLNENLPKNEILELVEEDAGSGKTPFGQDVRNVFVQGDFFFRIGKDATEEDLKLRVDRSLHLIFDTKVITPTSHETAMYHAKSAAKNSACLSRQVGAAVTDELGHVLGVGWNDVPKFGGNLYSTDETDENHLNDRRCMNLGYENGILASGDGVCFNDYEKNFLSEELVSELISHNLISNENQKQAIDVIRNSKVKSLIEYSRSVHAEMHAIILGSQISGDKMKDGRLYCTTYPCHNCARHIIVAGITEVYYIEPYVKSLCIKLHSDAITEDETDLRKVRILMFDGVSPNRYIKFFDIHGPRKNSRGNAIKHSDLTLAKPKTQLTLRDLPSLEIQAAFSLKKTNLLETIVEPSGMNIA